MDSIETVTLQDVEVQANGIVRNEKGYLIARLVDGVNFHSEHVRALMRGGIRQRKGLQTHGMATENSRGEWVPPIPCPYYFGWGLKKCRCECGETFKNEELYRGHYALKHILFPDKK
jgi:hypothetical protein